MASTQEENANGLKNSISGNGAVYTTIKAQYPGSWNDDLVALGKLVGMSPADIIKLNPWLTSNNFVANNHDYAVLQLKVASSTGQGGSHGINGISDGYYVTNEWTMPLGVGTWFTSQEYKSSHKALDLTTGIATQIAGYPVYAAKAGTVVQCYYSKPHDNVLGWGNTILIRHDDTKDENGNCYYTRYAHLISLPTQKVGDKVSQADKIGAVGNTGTSTGYHLHFQIYWTSATRTDYTNFTGTSDFSVNPNDIPEFPGIPYVQGTTSTVNYQKCDLVSENDIEEFKRAIAGSEAENPMTESEWTSFTNGLIDRYLTGISVDKESDLGKYLKDFLQAQFDGIKKNGLESVYNLMNGGNFFVTLQNFCENVVNNAIWYIENKVGEVITTASQEFVASTKTNLKQWIFNATDTDPDSELGQSLGTYLDGYVDSIVNIGWSAVRSAISTGDVRQAAQVFLDQTKNTTIDYVANVMVHGATSAIKSYVPTIIDDENVANAVVSISTGVINVTVQSIGSVIKGQISVEQAAKNILCSAVVTVTQVAFNQLIEPVLVPWLTQGAMALITSGLSALGLSLGSLAGPIGALIGGLISIILSQLLNFLLQKLIGWFTQ